MTTTKSRVPASPSALHNKPMPGVPIRVGVVGCGNVMDGAYMPSIARLNMYQKVIEVVAACHPRKERCQSILDKWKIGHFTEDYRDLCRSDDIDLVLVLTSMQQHSTIALDALKAGKHVLVEKPMAVSLSEGAKLVELAKNSPGYLMCAPFVLLSPTHQAISKRIRCGDVGKACLGRARYGWSGPDWAEWFYRAGNGCIFDLAVYSITSLTGLLGPVKRVMAMTGVAMPHRTVNGSSVDVTAEDNAQIMMDFGDSSFAVVTSGFTMQKYRSPALEIYGTKGTIQMLGDDWAPEGYELWQNALGAWQYFSETDPNWSWTSGLLHLVDCIQRGIPPIITPEHAYHVLEVLLAAQASGLDGNDKRIESTFTLGEHDDEGKVGREEHRVHDRRRE